MIFAETEGTGISAGGFVATPCPHASTRGECDVSGAFRFPLGFPGAERASTREGGATAKEGRAA